jgi:hypothetical protein
MKANQEENHPKSVVNGKSNLPLEQIVHVANRAVQNGLLLREFQYRCGSGVSDGSQAETDELAALVLSWLKASCKDDLHGFDQFMASASYINAAVVELQGVKNELAKAGSDFVLKEFWAWFVEQDRSSFDIPLLSSWIDVHPSRSVRQFKTDIVQHLIKRVPELWNLTMEMHVDVDNEWLSKLPEEFRPVTKPLETQPETDKTEAVTETTK